MTFKISKQTFSKRSVQGVLALILIAIVGVFWACRHSSARVSENHDDSQFPVAGVAKVTRQDLYRQVTIAAEFRPYVEVALHAKVAGYVKDMNVDIGDKVKAGELLA